ncbi:hypothetical protein [Deinococcus ruber]|uniref:Tetratricopeptide repeat protein n=1 Tax=Deinococcus ruber TaxID=1848197 RepID=A0A918F9G6_9DEIO|nr:hypothetical protein [Deinococcus ruber]GGR18221.1 hypothetical protein GCM10008957_33740 [Deinococcus ruber]
MTETHSATQQEHLFQQGAYLELIELLKDVAERTARQQTLLGLAYFRLGRMQDSRPLLAAALKAREPEAMVEWGNFLRAQGRFAEAQRYLSDLLPELSGELAFRALRWLGVCEHKLGLPGALEHIEAARNGYLRLGDVEMAARTEFNLAVSYALNGHARQAMTLLQSALPILEQQPNPYVALSALAALSDVQLELQLYQEAVPVLAKVAARAEALGSVYTQVRTSIQTAQLHLVCGQEALFLEHIQRALTLNQVAHDSSMDEFALSYLADSHSRHGDHRQAADILLRMHSLGSVQAPSLLVQLMEAMLARRRGDLVGALRQVITVQEAAADQNHALLGARAGLQRLFVLYLMRDVTQVRALLPEALHAVMRFGTAQAPLDMRHDLPELADLFVFAAEDPMSAPLVASLLAVERGSAAVQPPAPVSQLELLVLDQQTALKDGVPLAFGSKVAVAMLLYMAMVPGATPQHLVEACFPGDPPRVAQLRLRRVLEDIERVAGPLVVLSGPYDDVTYQVSTRVVVSSDLQQLRLLFANNDVRYRGVVLPRLDALPWVAALRSEVQASVRKILNGLLPAALQHRDAMRVMQLCEQGLLYFPGDRALSEASKTAALTVSEAAMEQPLRFTFDSTRT